MRLFRPLLIAAAVFLAVGSTAEARRHHPRAAAPVCNNPDIMRPCISTYDPNIFSGARSMDIRMKRDRRAEPAGLGFFSGPSVQPLPRQAARIARGDARQSISSSHSGQYVGAAIGAPSRYIRGRLICAVNVGAALEERGIKGTGSALAMSYLHWGRSAGGPVPGAVIVSARRGGGHVAIVSRVREDGVVMAWNATGGQDGWREIEYRHHVIDYRVPG